MADLGISLTPAAFEIWRSEQDRIKTIIRQRSFRKSEIEAD